MSKQRAPAPRKQLIVTEVVIRLLLFTCLIGYVLASLVNTLSGFYTPYINHRVFYQYGSTTVISTFYMDTLFLSSGFDYINWVWFGIVVGLLILAFLCNWHRLRCVFVSVVVMLLTTRFALGESRDSVNSYYTNLAYFSRDKLSINAICLIVITCLLFVTLLICVNRAITIEAEKKIALEKKLYKKKLILASRNDLINNNKGSKSGSRDKLLKSDSVSNQQQQPQPPQNTAPNSTDQLAMSPPVTPPPSNAGGFWVYHAPQPSTPPPNTGYAPGYYPSNAPAGYAANPQSPPAPRADDIVRRLSSVPDHRRHQNQNNSAV